MNDILRHFYVDVRCDQCGDFTVGADVVAESQRLLAEGCSGSQFECPPELFATLLDPNFLQSLEKAWSSPERPDGIEISQHPRGNARRVVVRLIPEPDTRNLSVWEDDGGYVPLRARNDPC